LSILRTRIAVLKVVAFGASPVRSRAVSPRDEFDQEFEAEFDDDLDLDGLDVDDETADEDPPLNYLGLPVDDEDDSGLGPAFDPDDEDADGDQYAEAPALSDDEAEAVLRRFLQIEEELLGRWPESKLEPSLDRVALAMELLGEPNKSFSVIHIAGTNGKTSTSRMTESLLRSVGLRTGLYTSPHLHTVRERIRLDGEPIDMERFVRVYDDIAPILDLADQQSVAVGGPRMSFFEAITCLAYAVFADAPVDVAVVEAGMGGRWDATNVADGQVAVVMPIGLDHMEYLGHDIATIANEKAGIIKPDAFVVLAQQPLEAATVLLAQTAEVGGALAREGLEFGVVSRLPGIGGQLLTVQGLAGQYDELFLPLFGAHQASNAAAAVAAVEAFLGGGEHELSVDLLREGFANVTSPARLEVVRRSPTVLIDAAHNPHGAAALAAALEDAFEFNHLVGVLAVFGDKDARGLLETLEPVLNEAVITQSTSPRAMPAEVLGELAAEIFGPDRIRVVPRLSAAIEMGIQLADEAAAGVGGAGVLVTGSVVTAAEARALLGRTEA